MTRGAQLGDVDTIRREPGIFELRAHDGPCVHEPVPRTCRVRNAGHRRVPRIRLRIRNKPSLQTLVASVRTNERGADLRADLVATQADRRTGGRDQIVRPAAEFARQCGDRSLRHVRGEPAPARVRRGDHPGTRIGNQQRNAIRRLHRDGVVAPGDDDVGLRKDV